MMTTTLLLLCFCSRRRCMQVAREEFIRIPPDIIDRLPGASCSLNIIYIPKARRRRL